MGCLELAAAFRLTAPSETASKPVALQTLRPIRRPHRDAGRPGVSRMVAPDMQPTQCALGQRHHGRRGQELVGPGRPTSPDSELRLSPASLGLAGSPDPRWNWVCDGRLLSGRADDLRRWLAARWGTAKRTWHQAVRHAPSSTLFVSGVIRSCANLTLSRAGRERRL